MGKKLTSITSLWEGSIFSIAVYTSSAVGGGFSNPSHPTLPNLASTHTQSIITDTAKHSNFI